MKRSFHVILLACIAAISLAAQTAGTAPAKKGSPSADTTKKAAGSSADAGAKVGVIDINTASADQLKQIPGIGDAYSQKIVAGRPYRAKNELVSKGILPAGVYAKVKEHLVAKAGGAKK